MDRRSFLRRTSLGLFPIVLPLGVWNRNVIRIPATLHGQRFARGGGDDAHYHALVHEEGGAAEQSLLTTPCSDREVAAELRSLGAQDGGGVPMAAWNQRRLPLVRAPETRVSGSPMRIWVEWEGWAEPRELASLLQDPGGQGVRFRFGGNEEHDHHWESGCIACLYSCPGGVISNERYTLRQYVRGATRFLPVEGIPPDGTAVTVILELE